MQALALSPSPQDDLFATVWSEAFVDRIGLHIEAAAGTVHYLTLDEMRGAISELGYTPRRRNVFYELVDEAPLEPAAA